LEVIAKYYLGSGSTVIGLKNIGLTNYIVYSDIVPLLGKKALMLLLI
jgi:hypothetical protein